MEKPSGPYPTLVSQLPKSERTADSRIVPVIQAYAFTKYLGHFEMEFDDAGEMTSWEGKPMLMGPDVKQGTA